MLDRVKQPEFRQVDKINFIKPEKQLLDNKIPVYTINAGDQNLVRVEFIFRNVNWNAQKPLLTYTANTMLTEGTNQLSASEIVSEIDYYGAFFQAEYTADYSAVSLFSLNKYLKNTLPVVKEVLTDSVFPEKELTTFIKNQKQKLKVNLEKNDFVARRTFNQLMFGNTLYGTTIEEKHYDELNREDLLSFFKKMYHPGNCTIIVSGKAGKEVVETLNDLFGDWTSQESFTENVFSFNVPLKQFRLVEKENALQSAIRLGIPTVNRKHPDYPGLQVLNTVLGGYFGSRLMANIREDKGYTYGIGSANVSYAQTGAFFIASEVGVNVCKNTLAEIEKEINLLKTVLIPDEELSLVRNYLMGSLLGSLENAFSHAEKFKSIYFLGLDYSYYDFYIKTIKNINSEELKQLANKYLNYDDFVKVVVGKF